MSSFINQVKYDPLSTVELTGANNIRATTYGTPFQIGQGTAQGLTVCGTATTLWDAPSNWTPTKFTRLDNLSATPQLLGAISLGENYYIVIFCTNSAINLYVAEKDNSQAMPWINVVGSTSGYDSNGYWESSISFVTSPDSNWGMVSYDSATNKLKFACFTYSNNTPPSDTFLGVGIELNVTNYLKVVNSYLGKSLSVQYEKYSPDYGTPSVPEGYGTGTGGSFDDSSDTIAIPSAPAMGITNAGFVNIYKITSNALQQFGAELFPDFSFTPISQLPAVTDVQTAIENVAQVLVDFGNQIPAMIDMYINNTLINYILDCHIIPVNPVTSGTANIKVGFKTFTPSAGIVTSDYVDFDCGSLNIAEYYANFIDYAPYTTAKLFLPFIGFVEVLPEFWQAGNINILYRFNIIDGSFMAFIRSTSSKSKLSNSVIAQYGGNCCVHIPITGANYSNMVTGLIGAAAGVVAGGAGVASIAGGAASALNTVATRSGMQNSNGYNSTTAFLGIRKPYLLIERTIADFSETYDTERGIPANITAKLSTVSGFTTSSAIHLDNITGATSAELDEIASLLAGGVIL